MQVHAGGIFLARGELVCWNLDEIPRHRMAITVSYGLHTTYGAFS